jgi:hypothetical protein
MFGNFIEHGRVLRRQFPVSNKRARLRETRCIAINTCFLDNFFKSIAFGRLAAHAKRIHPASFAGLGKTCN